MTEVGDDVRAVRFVSRRMMVEDTSAVDLSVSNRWQTRMAEIRRHVENERRDGRFVVDDRCGRRAELFVRYECHEDSE